MGPFIAIVASALTFLAFWVQYQANIQQRSQYEQSLQKQKEDLENERKTWKVERFENRFYELLRLHRENVAEMNIADKITGRKCFVHMFYEFKYCYLMVTDVWRQADADIEENYRYSQINPLDIAYRIFFYGLGFHSEKHFVSTMTVGELHLFRAVIPNLKTLQDAYTKFEEAETQKQYLTYGITLSGLSDDRSIDLYYHPYDGHVNRLGHYYRHLFQTANYVTDQNFLEEEEKYSYLKTLRAQLSNFEQLMLYYNALAWFDVEWKALFTTYRFIKNLPVPLADFHVRPEVHFQKEIAELASRGKAMFEYHE